MVTRDRPGHGGFWRLRLLAVALLVALFVWFISGKLGRVVFTMRVQTVAATYGTAETNIVGDALILREESVVTAPAPGRITLLVGEGRRVRAGDVICEVNNEGSTGAVPVGLEDITRRLNRLDAAAEAERGWLERREEELRGRLGDAERVMKDALASGASDVVAGADARRTDLRRELRGVEAAFAEIAAESEVAREALLQERESLLQLRPSDVALVRAPTSGFVSFSLDGLEEEARPGLQLLQLQESPRLRGSRIEDGVKVSRGDPLFRLVEGVAVEVVIRAHGKVAPQTGSQVNVAFRTIPERTFSGRLTEVLITGETVLARVRLETFDPSLIHQRFDEAVLSTNRAQGILVPPRAIIEVEGARGVYIMVGRKPVFRAVRILGGNRERAVVDSVDGVPVGAPVVINPELILKRRRVQAGST